jgi:PHD/YefM family antitoxin component YafN of YafNO toxin-antitoxin module
MGLAEYPVIDPTIKHVGVSKLRELNASKLKETEDTFVIQDNNTPLAVLLTYDKYMAIQQELTAVLNTMDLLTESGELAGVLAGIADFDAGKSRSLEAIEADLGE